jgi:hypothetical protein
MSPLAPSLRAFDRDAQEPAMSIPGGYCNHNYNVFPS